MMSFLSRRSILSKYKATHYVSRTLIWGSSRVISTSGKNGNNGTRRPSHPKAPKEPTNSRENETSVIIHKNSESSKEGSSTTLIPMSKRAHPVNRKHFADYSYRASAEMEASMQILQETMKTLKHPRMITQHLDDYVVGQENAKKILSVAVFNHYKRLEANLHSTHISQGSGFKVVANPNKSHMTNEKPQLDKSNVLIIGPTGSGKTLLAKTLAQILHVPFSMNDATPFTQAGYVGEDVEVVIQRLLQNSEHNVKLAEQGIVFIDEIDKIARKNDALSQSRDVSGEGVQQSLLRILEGTNVSITEKNMSPRSGSMFPGGKTETFQIDTTNVLFILSGAFVGLDRIVSDRLAKSSIGFNATVRKSGSNSNSGAAVNPLFSVDPSDLIKFGFIPEFIGRLPVIAAVSNLTEDAMVRILTEPKNCLTKQYEELFHLYKMKLVFTEAALRNVSTIALKKRSGARGLRRIMENILLDPMYDAPESQYKFVVINKDVIHSSFKPFYFNTEEYDQVIKLINDDDGEVSPRIRSTLKRIPEYAKHKPIIV